jgi:hypothetical protein
MPATHLSPIATPKRHEKSDCRNALNANATDSAGRQVGQDDEMKAVRLLVVISITHGKRFSSPSINHYKIPIQEETAYVAGEMVAQERTPECSARGRGSDDSGRRYYFPAPQQRTFISFCITLGFSACCCLGCGAFGLDAGTARLADARFGWLCWNCACVEDPSGGASSPILFLLICESRCTLSLGLLPGWARVAPGFGRGSFKRWWSMGR